MSNVPSDYQAERSLLTRKLSFWRLIAILTVVICAACAGVWFTGAMKLKLPHVARVSIEGIIIGDKSTLDVLRDVRESPSVKGIVLSIDSPGGTVTGSERLYNEIRKTAEKKPIVVMVRDVAASGAYMAALGGDRIFSYRNSIVGSIGVLWQYPDVTALLDRIGVKVEEIKSSPLKASPNGYTPTPPGAKQAIDAMILDSFSWFKGLVKERRKMTDEELKLVSDGRVFTGHQSIDLKLVDQLGDETDAVAWLVKEKQVPADLPIHNWSSKSTRKHMGLLGMARIGADFAGFSSISYLLDRIDASAQARMLDGPVMVWQGSSLKEKDY